MPLQVVRDVLTSDYRGPRAVFSEAHVLRAILAIGENGTVGRGRLGALVGLGQGEIRTLIKRMKENDIVVIEREGCKLSKKGEKEFRKLRNRVPWAASVQASALGLGEKCFAILVRGERGALRKGIEQRDSAIRVGARGALTAVFARGHFRLPGEDQDSEKGGPAELWSAARSAGPLEGDVLIVVGAEGEEAAELGALAAALTLF